MKKRIIDLSFTFQKGMQTFTSYWHPAFEITQLAHHGVEKRETRKIVMGTHTGTHVDAPRHFIKGGETIENIPLDVFIGPATILDFSKAPQKSEIGLKDVMKALGKSPCERVIFRFDWDKKYGTKQYYINHPFLSEEVCRWLVKRKCKLIGFDTPQPDNPENGFGKPKDGPNHKILLGAGVILLEYLTNLKKIKQKTVQLVAAPLKIKEGDGAPTRCFVIEDV